MNPHRTLLLSPSSIPYALDGGRMLLDGLVTDSEAFLLIGVRSVSQAIEGDLGCDFRLIHPSLRYGVSSPLLTHFPQGNDDHCQGGFTPQNQNPWC
jgi:hypothetical protein